MREYCLNIAGYNIKVKSAPGGPLLGPSARFEGSRVQSNKHDILIRVHAGQFILPAGAERVFHAPFVGEREGKTFIRSEEFWDVYRDKEGGLYICTIFPLEESQDRGTLIFSLQSDVWELWIEGKGGKIDPLAYPLDGLLLYYLTVISNDIMIHASGVGFEDRGYIFSGVSGKGKSTIARLWHDAGARVIHDDRLIIRKMNGEYRFYNTPVYNNDKPLEAPLSAIFLIEHGMENRIEPLSGVQAVSQLLANCIQHNWDKNITGNLVNAITDMCEKIRVFRFYFKPEPSAINFILDHEHSQKTYR